MCLHGFCQCFVWHVFGQSTYTYITGTSYCAGLDLTLKQFNTPKDVSITKIIPRFCSANMPKSGVFPPTVIGTKRSSGVKAP